MISFISILLKALSISILNFFLLQETCFSTDFKVNKIVHHHIYSHLLSPQAKVDVSKIFNFPFFSDSGNAVPSGAGKRNGKDSFGFLVIDLCFLKALKVRGETKNCWKIFLLPIGKCMVTCTGLFRLKIACILAKYFCRCSYKLKLFMKYRKWLLQ